MARRHHHRSDQEAEEEVGVLPHRAAVEVEAEGEEAAEAEEGVAAEAVGVVQLVRCWRLPLGGSCRNRRRRCR